MLLCIGLTTLPPSCANYLDIWEPQPPADLYRDCFTSSVGYHIKADENDMVIKKWGIKIVILIAVVRLKYYPCNLISYPE